MSSLPSRCKRIENFKCTDKYFAIIIIIIIIFRSTVARKLSALVSIIFWQWYLYILQYWTYPLIFLFIINRAQQYLQKSREWWGFFFGFAFCWTLPFATMNSYSSTGNLFVFNLQIDSCCKLSGMPDLSLCFVNSRLLEDPSFHPCVRLKRWEVSITVNLC